MKYEHTDTNHALWSATRLLAKLVATHVKEETAADEARAVLSEINTREDDSAWLTDKLTQLTCDFEFFLNYEELMVKGADAVANLQADGGSACG